MKYGTWCYFLLTREGHFIDVLLHAITCHSIHNSVNLTYSFREPIIIRNRNKNIITA